MCIYIYMGPVEKSEVFCSSMRILQSPYCQIPAGP